MTTTPELTPLLEAIDRMTQSMLAAIPVDKRLWTSETCAQYLSYSTAHFLARIACRPDFPKAHHIGSGDKGRRWKAAEVIEWAEER